MESHECTAIQEKIIKFTEIVWKEVNYYSKIFHQRILKGVEPNRKEVSRVQPTPANLNGNGYPN